MGFFDRLFGRNEPQLPPQRQQAPQRSEDQIALERYQYLLRTAPPETIEKVHAEAFAKLTPQQRDLLFAQLTKTASTPSERPADAQPSSLAQAATRAELQQPGTLTRTLGGGFGAPGFGGVFASSLLGSVAGYVIGSALFDAFMPGDNGNDANGSASNDNSNDSSNDNSASNDNSGADNGSAGGVDSSTDASAASYDGGGYDGGGDFGGGYDNGGDFGGGDFGGGDFGGGDF